MTSFSTNLALCVIILLLPQLFNIPDKLEKRPLMWRRIKHELFEQILSVVTQINFLCDGRN